MKYQLKLLLIFAVPTIILLVLSFGFGVIDLEICISIISILATVVIALYFQREQELLKKLEEAGVEFCPDNAKYLDAVITLIRDSKQNVLSLLSTWHVEKEILEVLKDCEASNIVFVGPIDKGERFPRAIDRIRKTIEINQKRLESGKAKIKVFHRESSGIKFVIADDKVLINSRPMKASANRGTAGFVIKDSSDHARFFTDAFNSILRDTGKITAIERIEKEIFEIIKEREPITLDDIATGLHTEGTHTGEEDKQYKNNLDWYIDKLSAKKFVRRTKDGRIALDSISHPEFGSLADNLKKAMQEIKENPKPYLSIAVTNLCNFNCRYCPPDGECYRTTSGEFNCEAVSNVIDIAQGLGMSKIRITGGEPFIYKDLQKVVEHAVERNLEVHINSNGVGLTKNLAWLTALKNHVFIKISIDYASKKTMAIMTPTSDHLFDEVKLAINRCAETGMLQRLNFVLTTKNWQDLPGVLELARNCGVGLKVFDMFFVPETEKEWRELYLPPRIANGDRYADFSYAYSLRYGIPTEELEVDGTKIRIKDSTNGTHYHADFCNPESCDHYPCQEGLYCLVVTPSLTVVPCRLGIGHYARCENTDGVMKAVEKFLKIYETSVLSREFHKDYIDFIDERKREYLSKCKHLLCAADSNVRL